MRFTLGRPSPAMVVALVALFVALGGSSYAALKVGTKQLRNNAVTSAKIKNGTIITKDIKKKTRAALRGARGTAGPPGRAGPSGPTGATGAPGSARAYAAVDAAGTFVGAHPGFSAVRQPGGYPGNYCLTPEAGLPHDRLRYAVASIAGDYWPDVTGDLSTHIPKADGPCGANDLEVETFGDETLVNHFSRAFNIIIP